MRTQWPHAERHNIHGAALHATGKETIQRRAHFRRRNPVVGRTGIFFFLRTDIGAIFHASHIARIGQREIGIRAQFFVEFLERTGRDQLPAETIVFFGRTIAPVNTCGPGQRGNFIHPRQQFCVACGCLVQMNGPGLCVHPVSPENGAAGCGLCHKFLC